MYSIVKDKYTDWIIAVIHQRQQIGRSKVETIKSRLKAREVAGNIQKGKEMTLAELKDYEIQEFRKAFEEGTEKGWKNYRLRVRKAAMKFEKETGLQVDLDELML